MQLEAIYARQSIEKKDSLSIEQQIERCRAKADNSDTCIIYQESKSGKSTLNRNEFNRMMDDVRGGRISKIIVYRLDRISRSLADFAKMWEELKSYNVQFVSCSEEFDTTTAMGDAMLKIAMVFAEMERRIIVQRVTDSYFNLAKRGHNLGGYAPFGYIKIDHKIDGKRTKALQVDPAYRELILSTFRRYSETDVSIGRIAKELHEMGVKSARGGGFTSSSLGRILRSPVYARADEKVYAYLKSKGATLNNDVDDYQGFNGCYIYAPQSDYTPEELAKRQYKKRKSGRKFSDLSQSYITLAPHEGIVPADVWLACQYKLDNNKQIPCDRSGTHTWMSGLMRCANCNTGITVVNNNRGRNYINCYGRKKHECNGRSYAWRLEEVEESAEYQFLERLKKVKEIQAKDFEQSENPKLSILRAEIIKLDALLSKIEDEILATASESTKTRWRQKQDQIQQRIDNCNAEISKLMHDDNLKRRTIDDGIDIDHVLKNWANKNAIEMVERKRIARLFIDFIVVGDTKEEGVRVYFK